MKTRALSLPLIAAVVGAFALALARGEPVADCLKVGVVAAGAACTTLGTRLCEKATVDALLPDAVLTRL